MIPAKTRFHLKLKSAIALQLNFHLHNPWHKSKQRGKPDLKRGSAKVMYDQSRKRKQKNTNIAISHEVIQVMNKLDTKQNEHKYSIWLSLMVPKPLMKRPKPDKPEDLIKWKRVIWVMIHAHIHSIHWTADPEK